MQQSTHLHVENMSSFEHLWVDVGIAETICANPMTTHDLSEKCVPWSSLGVKNFIGNSTDLRMPILSTAHIVHNPCMHFVYRDLFAEAVVLSLSVGFQTWLLWPSTVLLPKIKTNKCTLPNCILLHCVFEVGFYLVHCCPQWGSTLSCTSLARIRSPLASRNQSIWALFGIPETKQHHSMMTWWYVVLTIIDLCPSSAFQLLAGSSHDAKDAHSAAYFVWRHTLSRREVACLIHQLALTFEYIWIICLSLPSLFLRLPF